MRESSKQEVNSKMRIGTFLAILGLLALIGCSASGTKTAAAGSTDADLERSIKAQIATDPQVPASDVGVSANAERNEATLSGSVPTEEARTRIEYLAKTSRPGLSITDTIQVKPIEVARSEYTEGMAREAREKAEALGDKIGKSLDDAWIYTKIVSKLATNQQTPALKINVDVTDKAVTLRGQVESSAAKMEAERVAKDTDGVKKVSNMLKVKTSSSSGG
jgi:osmotically-inducible protein OsmY